VNILNVAAQLARVILGTGLALLLAACATKPEIRSDYDRSANFATYHTFTIMQRQHPGIQDPLVAIHVEEAITQELQRRGYVLVADSTTADFTVDFTLGTKDRIAINSYPGPYAGPLFWGSGIDVHQYSEGTLSIDVFDQRTERPVWHGSAQKELVHKDLDQPSAATREAVSSVLARFPPA
jgi:hypothetical protein